MKAAPSVCVGRYATNFSRCIGRQSRLLHLFAPLQHTTKQHPHKGGAHTQRTSYTQKKGARHSKLTGAV